MFVLVVMETFKFFYNQHNIMGDKTTIEIPMKIRDRMMTFGNMGDHYADVLGALMDACEPALEFRQNLATSREAVRRILAPGSGDGGAQ